MRFLYCARFDDDVVKSPMAALVGKSLAGRPGPAQEIDRLLEARRGFRNWNRKAFEFGGPVAFANAEIEAAITEKIEGCHLFSEQDRVVPWQHDNGRAETYALGAPGKIAQEVQRCGELPNAREVVLDHEDAVKTELLCAQDVVDILAVSNAVSGRPLTGRLGSAKQAKFHCRASAAAAELRSMPYVDAELRAIRHFRSGAG